MFVIPCKFIPTSPVVFDCVANIRKYHPDDKIVVVDSASDDRLYLGKLQKEFNVIPCDVHNVGYMDGAIWYAYNAHLDNFYYFLQDSMILNSSLKEYEANDITSIRFWKSGTGRGWVEDRYRFDDNTQEEWSRRHLQRMGVKMESIFIGLFGPQLLVKRAVLEKLAAMGMDKAVPVNKMESMAMERVWGIVLAHLGYDITKNCIQGDFFGNIDESKVRKVFLHRA